MADQPDVMQETVVTDREALRAKAQPIIQEAPREVCLRIAHVSLRKGAACVDAWHQGRHVRATDPLAP